MKRILFLLFSIVLSHVAFGQRIATEACQKMSKTYADSISQSFILSGYSNNKTADKYIALWVGECGFTEPLLRIAILNELMKTQDAKGLIASYFENFYDEVFTHRVQDVQASDFQSIFNENLQYYGYIPLGDKFDAISKQLATNLLKVDSLPADAKDICTLFSGNSPIVENEIQNNNANNDLDSPFENFMYDYDVSEDFLLSAYSGVWIPFGKNNEIFSANPMLGVAFGYAVNPRYTLGLSTFCRLNIYDRKFKFLYQDTVRLVNSNYAYVVSGNLYYKLFGNQSFECNTSFNIGLETISTGLFDVSNDEEATYTFYNVKTLHLSAGLNFFRNKNEFGNAGIGIYYNYAPYQWSKDLKTDFSNHAISLAVLVRL